MDTISSNDLEYRTILPSDLIEIKELHEEFFPVRYVDEFYNEAVQSKGMYGEPLFSIIISTNKVCADNKNKSNIIGFILCQFLNAHTCEEKNLFVKNNIPAKVFYILTLGIKKEYRNMGLARDLVSKSVAYAEQNQSCGLVIYKNII